MKSAGRGILIGMTVYAIRQARGAGDRLPAALYVRNENRGPRLIKLVAVWSGIRARETLCKTEVQPWEDV